MDDLSSSVKKGSWGHDRCDSAPTEIRDVPQQHPEPRRRLAPNVVCMFAEERQRVVLPRWHGRYPRVVTRLAEWRQFWNGDVVVITKGMNAGKRLKILSWDRGEGFDEKAGPWYLAESLDGLLWSTDKNGPLQQFTECLISKRSCRKISRARP
jgi:hypothetical protein